MKITRSETRKWKGYNRENHPNNYERKGKEGFIMNSSDLVDIFKKVCQRLTTHQDRCGHLLYPILK